MSIDVRACLASARIVPVVTVPADTDAHGLAGPLAEALVQAGITTVEIALRTAGAETVLRHMASDPRLTVGAGTVLNAEQARRAHDAGARFLVSPGLDEDVVEQARDLRVPLVPGVATATELMRALRLALPTVKLFPAEQIGGLPLLKALVAPFPMVAFIPTGGIGPELLAAYLAVPQVLAVGGSWIVPPAALRSGDFELIRTRAAQAVTAAAS